MPPLSAFDWTCADIVNADLIQAGGAALQKHGYDQVLTELVRRVRGDRMYDGHPLRPSYEIRGGYVRIWKRETPMSAEPDAIHTLVDVVRRMFPDLRTITNATQLHPLLVIGPPQQGQKKAAPRPAPRPKKGGGAEEEEQQTLF